MQHRSQQYAYGKAQQQAVGETLRLPSLVQRTQSIYSFALSHLSSINNKNINTQLAIPRSIAPAITGSFTSPPALRTGATCAASIIRKSRAPGPSSPNNSLASKAGNCLLHTNPPQSGFNRL